MASAPFSPLPRNFVDPPPSHFECPICLHTLTEPHILSCCGVKICYFCLTKIQDTPKACPLCRDIEYTTMLEKQLHREILNLKVYCPNAAFGCKWVSEVRDLEQHNSICEYASSLCQYGCGKSYPHHLLSEHEETCENRPIGTIIKELKEEISLLKTKIITQQEEINGLREKVQVLENVCFRSQSSDSTFNDPPVMILPGNRTITIKKGDISEEDVDVIVVGTNSKLQHGGGVAAVLDEASDYKLQKFSDEYVRKHGFVPIGHTAVTKAGGRLKCKNIVQAIGPIGSARSVPSDKMCLEMIFQAVSHSLAEAEKLKATSIAFPNFSTTIFIMKTTIAADVMLEAILSYKFTTSRLKRICIVLHEERDYVIFADKVTCKKTFAHHSVDTLNKEFMLKKL